MNRLEMKSDFLKLITENEPNIECRLLRKTSANHHSKKPNSVNAIYHHHNNKNNNILKNNFKSHGTNNHQIDSSILPTRPYRQLKMDMDRFQRHRGFCRNCPSFHKSTSFQCNEITFGKLSIPKSSSYSVKPSMLMKNNSKKKLYESKNEPLVTDPYIEPTDWSKQLRQSSTKCRTSKKLPHSISIDHKSQKRHRLCCCPTTAMEQLRRPNVLSADEYMKRPIDYTFHKKRTKLHLHQQAQQQIEEKHDGKPPKHNLNIKIKTENISTSPPKMPSPDSAYCDLSDNEKRLENESIDFSLSEDNSYVDTKEHDIIRKMVKEVKSCHNDHIPKKKVPLPNELDCTLIVPYPTIKNAKLLLIRCFCKIFLIIMESIYPFYSSTLNHRNNYLTL
ncbi:hypothetical protein SNEBB_000215 [Seison nebaliae]|nr:hypothetical protein SNEBB_000215 [Seison nebaliae]